MEVGNVLFCEIFKLCNELNTGGHSVDIQKVVYELLDLSNKKPQEIKEAACAYLHETTRFEGHGVSLYTDTVGCHQERLSNIYKFTESILQKWQNSETRGTLENKTIYTAGNGFSVGTCDVKYLLFFLANHDIPEGIIHTIGDISTMVKKVLSKESSRTLGKIEGQGLNSIGAEGFDISSQYFEKFVRDTLKKESIEAILASYFDKLDGLGASLLEVLQGNPKRIEPLRNYIKIFQGLSNSFTGYLVRDIWQHAPTNNLSPLQAGSWERIKDDFSSFSPDIFNINEIISLDGQENIGIDACQRFTSDKELECFLEQKYLGKGTHFTWQNFNENALKLFDNIGLPMFFRAWIASQAIAKKEIGYNRVPVACLEHTAP